MPLRKQPHLASQQQLIVAREIPRQRRRLQPHQRANGILIKPLRIRAGLQRAGVGLVAKILQQQKPPLQVRRMNSRNRHPPVQKIAHRDKPRHILLRRRRVHRHQSFPAGVDAEITAKTGVPRQRRNPRARAQGFHPHPQRRQAGVRPRRGGRGRGRGR